MKVKDCPRRSACWALVFAALAELGALLASGCGAWGQFSSSAERTASRCVPEGLIALGRCISRVELEAECQRAIARGDRLPHPDCRVLPPASAPVR